MDLRTEGQPAAGGGAADAVAWRRARLRKAGFGTVLSESLSRTSAVDLHELIELVERGCSPSLAARIMAPLDHETGPC